jgi:putative addiction module component (TIGR02574 family)
MRTVATDPQDRLLREALDLPPEERAALAAKLIESLDGEAVDEGVEAAWATEIERRVREIKAGTAQTIPWEEARARIQQARDARRKG